MLRTSKPIKGGFASMKPTRAGLGKSQRDGRRYIFNMRWGQEEYVVGKKRAGKKERSKKH